MSNDRTAAARLTGYANIELDQARQAREAANALFKPKLQTPAVVAPAAPDAASLFGSPAPAKPAAPVAPAAPVTPTITLAPRVPRVLTAITPAEPAAAPTPAPKRETAPASSPATITESDHRRIRALALYGVSLGEIAADYGVAAAIIAPIVMQSELAGSRPGLAWA